MFTTNVNNYIVFRLSKLKIDKYNYLVLCHLHIANKINKIIITYCIVDLKMSTKHKKTESLMELIL